MSNEVIEENVAKMDPDLRIQMTQGGVPNHVIAVLAEAGFTSSKMFRFFSPSLEALPARAKLMGIDPEKDLVSMALVAKLQVVWATTSAYQVARETDDAEKKVLGMAREMNMNWCRADSSADAGVVNIRPHHRPEPNLNPNPSPNTNPNPNYSPNPNPNP